MQSTFIAATPLIVHAARGHLASSRSCLSFSMSPSSVFFCFSSLPVASSTLGCTMGVRSESSPRLPQQQEPIILQAGQRPALQDSRARRQLLPRACAVPAWCNTRTFFISIYKNLIFNASKISSSFFIPIIYSSFSDHDMEIVPNSSGEGSTCDEEMSQEFPPPIGKSNLL